MAKNDTILSWNGGYYERSTESAETAALRAQYHSEGIGNCTVPCKVNGNVGVYTDDKFWTKNWSKSSQPIDWSKLPKG